MELEQGLRINQRVLASLDHADKVLAAPLHGPQFAGLREMLTAYFACHAPELSAEQIESEVEAALADGAELRRQAME